MTAAASSGGACAGAHCITCGDDGVPMVVLRVDTARELALCEGAQGEHSTVETALVGAVQPGECLLVHAAVALVTLPAPEAAR